MRLYTETNSHVSPWDDANARVRICYNKIFGGLYTSADPTADPHVCSPEQNPNNVVLRNNSVTNAHVEGPRGATGEYSPLCYGDLNCEIRDADRNCQENWALVAYLSSGEGANKHVSKSPVAGWLKLCCHSPSHSNPPQPICGNGKIEGTEECDPPTAPDSSMQCTNPSKSVCNSTCSCEALPPTPPTKDIIVAEWRDANPVHEHVQVNKSALNGEVYLYGLTRYYDPGTLFTIEVFNTLDNRYPVATFNLTSNSNGEIVIDTELKAIASLAGGVVIDDNLYLNDFVGNDAQVGQNFTFNIVHYNGLIKDDEKWSSPIEVIPDGMITNWVNECGLINQSLLMGYTPEDVKALCIKSESSSILRNPDMCIDGSTTAKCAWNASSNTCYNQITLLNAATGERGICSYNVNYKTECSDTGFREAEVTTDYTGDPVCAGDCTSEGAITSIPCSRAFLSLPFFAAWQIAGAIVVLFFVYLVLIKTGIIGKKNSKKIESRRKR
jgi:hypothetical protein